MQSLRARFALKTHWAFPKTQKRGRHSFTQHSLQVKFLPPPSLPPMRTRPLSKQSNRSGSLDRNSASRFTRTSEALWSLRPTQSTSVDEKLSRRALRSFLPFWLASNFRNTHRWWTTSPNTWTVHLWWICDQTLPDCLWVSLLGLFSLEVFVLTSRLTQISCFGI